MDLKRQADFLQAAFDAWWELDGRGTADREAVFRAFVAGFLSADSLLSQLARDYRKSLLAALRGYAAQVRQEEREACAKVAEAYKVKFRPYALQAGAEIAATIRAREL